MIRTFQFDARDADAVVAGRADRPGDVRAVAVVVDRVVVVVRRSPSRASRRRSRCRRCRCRRAAAAAVLAGVDPHVGREVGVRVVDAGVDHRDRHTGAAGRDVPRLGGVDVGVRRAREAVDRLAGVVQAPEVRERRVVRRRFGVHDEVRLRVADARILAQLRQGRLDGIGAHMSERAVDPLEALLLHRADALEDVLLVCGRDVAAESDQELAGYRLLRGLLRRERPAIRVPRARARRRRRQEGVVCDGYGPLDRQGGRGRSPTAGRTVGPPGGRIVASSRDSAGLPWRVLCGVA